MNRRELLTLPLAAAVARRRQSRHFQTVVAFAETVIPGSTEARVAEHLEKLAAASDAAFQNAFLNDVEAIDQFAGAPFASLTADQRTAVLLRMQGNPSFENMKAWTARMYYATEQGTTDLNGGDNPDVRQAIAFCGLPIAPNP